MRPRSVRLGFLVALPTAFFARPFASSSFSPIPDPFYLFAFFPATESAAPASSPICWPNSPTRRAPRAIESKSSLPSRVSRPSLSSGERRALPCLLSAMPPATPATAAPPAIRGFLAREAVAATARPAAFVPFAAAVAAAAAFARRSVGSGTGGFAFRALDFDEPPDLEREAVLLVFLA